MTLSEAKKLAQETLGVIVLTPEGLVSRVYNASCIKETNDYKIYADGILIGSGQDPLLAWEDASENLPDFILQNYEQVTDISSFISPIYIKKEDYDDEKAEDRQSYKGSKNPSYDCFAPCQQA